MVDKNPQTDEHHDQEKLPRRRLFKMAAEIGVGLFAFIPAVQVLAKGIQSAASASPNYVPCQTVYCVIQQFHCGANGLYWCYDCRGAGFCYCSSISMTCGASTS